MACNTIPNSYPSLIVHLGEAQTGAEELGAVIPLLINTEEAIAANRMALMSAQTAYRGARGAIAPRQVARREAVSAAYDFCLKSRDVLMNYLGREWNEGWIAAGWLDTLRIPQGFDDLYDLTFTLTEYFTAHPTHQNTELGVTAAAAQVVFNSLSATNAALTNADVLSLIKRNTRDDAQRAARKRLSGLCKELSQRLEDLDPRWRAFGFNMPGAATVPEVPENVVVVPQPGARLQVSCDASPNATRYRFYLQRPIVDPEPVLAGGSDEPLFLSEALTPAQVYQVYVSAVNEGAESDLSDPVSATPVLAAAA